MITMALTKFLIIVAVVFFVLLGFFPIVLYIIWSIHNSLRRKKEQKEGKGQQAKHYHITRFKELRDNPKIRL